MSKENKLLPLKGNHVDALPDGTFGKQEKIEDARPRLKELGVKPEAVRRKRRSKRS